MKYVIPKVVYNNKPLDIRMVVECGRRSPECDGECGECLFDYSDINPDRKREFLKWEKENESKNKNLI